MLLIEADGKALSKPPALHARRTAVAKGAAAPAIAGPGPWIVKAQVPVGGRGKAGGMIRCDNEAAVRAALQATVRLAHHGHEVQRCRVETAVTGNDEYYLSLMIDPAHYGVRVTLIPEGGVDVEKADRQQRDRIRLCDPTSAAIVAAIRDSLGGTERRAGCHGRRRRQARASVPDAGVDLAEINPLFVDANGCVAGDAKVVVDLNAVHRQPEIALIEPAPYIRTRTEDSRRLRLCRGRPQGRDRPGHDRRWTLDDADRRVDRARRPAAELLRHPDRSFAAIPSG